MSAKKAIDWEAVELAYRAGTLSLAVIAKEHGISKGRIGQVAKEKGWERDLSGKVRAKRDALLNAANLNEDLNAKRASEQQVVEASALTQATLVLSHRKDISGQRSLVDVLKEQLTQAIGNRELIEMAIDEECTVAEDAPGFVKAQAEQRRKQMLKAVSLPGHIVALKDLSTVLKNLIPLERQAFNVDGEREQAPADGGAVNAATAVTLASIEAFGQKLRARMGKE